MRHLTELLSRLQTRHPLLLFLVLGGAVFFLAWEHPASEPGDPALPPVALGKEQRQALQQHFPQIPPEHLNAQQLHEVLGDWLDHEVLLREGRRLGLDTADPIIERRIAQKMDTLLNDLYPPPAPADSELRAWLHANKERYGDPPRYTFEQVYLSRSEHGSHAPSLAAEYLPALRSGKMDFRQLGNRFVTGPVVRDITPKELRKHFGKTFADSLVKIEPGNWQGPIVSGYGVHLVRVTRFTPFKPWTLETARARIEKEYRQHQRRQHQRELRNQLIEKYGIAIGNETGAPSS